MRTYLPWSCDMEGHAKKCAAKYCELASKTAQQLYKVSTPCLDDHQFKEDELESVGQLSKVCSVGIVSRFQFRGRSRKLEVYFGRNFCAFSAVTRSFP